MRKIILILISVLIIFCSLSVTAFASTEKYPMIETTYLHTVIYFKDDGTLAGCCFDSYDVSGSFLTANGGAHYRYIDGEWQYYTVFGSYRMGKLTTQFCYDTTGELEIRHPLDFIIPYVPIEFNDFNPFYDGLKGQITISNLVGVLVVGAGAVVGLVFLYWGVRKAVRALVKAFKKGHISL